MTTLQLEIEPAATEVTILDKAFSVQLADGRALEVPLAWYPRLEVATSEERQQWQLLGDGYAIEWPALDEHIGVESLLAGCRSGESPESLRRWLESRTTK